MAQRTMGIMSRFTNFKVCVEKNGAKAQVTLPGFTFDDFDRTGNLSISRLQKLLTVVRMFAYHAPNKDTGTTFLEYDKMTAERFTFMASASTTVERAFYSLPDVIPTPQLAVSIHLGYVGTSSLSTVAQLTNVDSGQILARNVNQVVTVDKTTRKPAPIPEWWKQKYGGLVVENERLICPPLPVPSCEGHSYKVKVPWSDTDRYRHTNFVSYLKYCMDSAMDGVTAGEFSKFREDILNYHVRKISMLYKGESNAGEMLDVTSREEKENPYTLYFDIKRDGKSIYQNTMDFFEPLTQKVTPNPVTTAW